MERDSFVLLNPCRPRNRWPRRAISQLRFLLPHAVIEDRVYETKRSRITTDSGAMEGPARRLHKGSMLLENHPRPLIADPSCGSSRLFDKGRTWVCGRSSATWAYGVPQLRMTKTGNSMLRPLLDTAAHRIMGPFGQDTYLRRFGLRLAERGRKAAKKRAVVAVARKLSILLHRLWISGEVYQASARPLREGRASCVETGPWRSPTLCQLSPPAGRQERRVFRPRSAGGCAHGAAILAQPPGELRERVKARRPRPTPTRVIRIVEDRCTAASAPAGKACAWRTC
jgi:hypothetical protein